MKNLRIKQLAAALLWSLVPLLATAQRTSVAGTIKGDDGTPLPGATVIAVGTLGGTAAAVDGSYHLTLSREGTYTIQVSFIGFETATRTLTVTGQVTADFTLSQAAIPAAEVVVSATRAGNRTPVTYKTITGDEIRKKNFGSDMPFLLAMTPSLVETSEAGNGIGYTAMRIRGSDASRINVTIDGIPLNDAESQQVFWVDLPDFAASVESVQVQRGVGTSGNGAGAFGASVNIQTVSPGNDPVAAVTTSLGSFNTFKQSVIAGSGLISDRVSLLMRYSTLRSDGYVRHSGSDHRSMFVTGVYSMGRSRLKANVILGEERTGISWWGVTPEMMEVDRRYNPAGVYTDGDGVEPYYVTQTDNYWQNHYHLIYSINLGGGLLLHTAAHLTDGRGYYEQYKEDRDFDEFGLDQVVIGNETFTTTDMIHRKWNDNVFYGITWALKYDNGFTDASLGGALNTHYGDHFGRIIWMRYPGDTESGYEWYLNNAVKDEFNIYGKVSHLVMPRFSLFADLQYRSIDYTMEGPDDSLLELDLGKRYHFVNPKAGLFWSPSPSQDIFASVAVAHREPTRANFKDAIGDDAATPQPERLTDFEAGYVLRSAAASLNVNLYYMMYHNQLVPTGELSNVGYPIMTNVTDSYRAGAEVSVAVRPSPIIGWNINMTLSSNKIKDFIEYYTEYNTSDWSEQYLSRSLGTVDIAYSPSVIASTELLVNPFDGAEVRLTGKYVGQQYFDNTMSHLRRLDPYFVANAAASYSFGFKGVSEASVSLSVNNILNSMYVSNAYGGNWFEDGVEQTWAYYFPQAGINYMLKVGFTF
ncbi:MAG: TonB-dependent receptor [Bacteroidales bacterium]|nr:TonB-dependent receptor [Bacteroidales bacterium]